MRDEPPRRITDRVLNINLTGNLAPFYNDDQPVLLLMGGGGGEHYLCTFTGKTRFDQFMADYPAGRVFEKVIIVDDGREFLDSIPVHIHVIVDPYKHENGMMRYQEVQR